MPNLDINTSDAFPYDEVEYPFNPIGFGATPHVIQQGYHEFPFREFRETSHRNSKVAGGPKIPSPFKLRLLQWYTEKPKIFDYISKKKMRRAFHLAKVDWRRRRPVRSLLDNPPGWHVVEVATDKFARVMTGTDPLTKLAIFRNQALTVKRLRPYNRAWRRQSPNVALNANVNDLVFWKQSGGLYGSATIGLTNNLSYYNNNPPSGGGTSYGNLVMHGFQTDEQWTALGFTASPYELPQSTDVVEPLSLLVDYADRIDELSNLALKRHYDKIANKKIDLATETAQAMQTVNMIVDLSIRVGKTFTFLKKLNLVGAFETLFPTSRKELANDFLVYQYGIKPLLGDVVAAAEHLAEYVTKARPVKSNGHAQKTWNDNELFSFADDQVAHYRSVNRTVSIRVKYGSIYKISDELSRQAAQLGFTNPANVLWELVPYSFVADWFLPVGDFLTNLTALNGLVIKESYKTVFITIDESLYEAHGSTTGQFIYPYHEASPVEEHPLYYLQGTPRLADQSNLWVRNCDRGSYSRTVFCKREVIDLPDVPLPRFKNPISILHLEEALALFSQLRK